MLPKSLIRYHVKAQFPNLDNAAITGITNKVHEFAFSECDLVPSRIQGAGTAWLRHNRTNYDEQLKAHASQYFGGARKMFQEAANLSLKLKYGV